MRLPFPFNPALYDLPTVEPIPVGITHLPPFIALTVYRTRTGTYQASVVKGKGDGYVIAIKDNPNDAINACIHAAYVYPDIVANRSAGNEKVDKQDDWMEEA